MAVRKDLPLAQQLVQSAHAAYEAGQHLNDGDPTVNHLVLCEVPDEEHLVKMYERIEGRGIRCVLFKEPDIGNQATALCTEPVSGKARRLFSKYTLWGRET